MESDESRKHGAVDCEVSGWSPWGKCRNQCGIGSQEREREIEVFPQNGGRACPVSRQKRVCVGYEDCLQQSVEYQGAELRETGKILPAKFGIWRTAQEYDPKQGINWNLFAQYHSNEILRRPAYCSEYEIITSHKRCETSVAPWAGVLKEGGRMCVECQPTAMHKKLGMRCKGHGVFREETTWTAVDVPGCHGSWVMKKRHEDCTCNVHGDFDFILI